MQSDIWRFEDLDPDFVILVTAAVDRGGAEVEALVSWILDPARSQALWVLAAGIAAVVASVAVRALRGRPV